MIYLNNFDLQNLNSKLVLIDLDNDNVRAYPNNITVFSLEEFAKELSQELLWIEAKDIWCVKY